MVSYNALQGGFAPSLPKFRANLQVAKVIVGRATLPSALAPDKGLEHELVRISWFRASVAERVYRRAVHICPRQPYPLQSLQALICQHDGALGARPEGSVPWPIERGDARST